MSQQITYYTEEGLQKLKEELHNLKHVERPKISNQIAEARDKGDLSENAEYDAAKEAQGHLEARISKMEELVANARVVDESQIDDSKAYILSKVKIKNLNNNAEVEYTLVAESEADLAAKKISIDSPIGKGLLGKEVGDIAEVQVPAGIIKFEILGISR
ncbi:MAG: transcription elongation factor GreA [Flavobacteriales bacterium]|nr:transcription elongation factor GreA [Flavobacteriales bacterium]